MKKRTIIILFIISFALILGPLFNTSAEFAGADDQAEEMINVIDENYKPWFSPVWEPPSGEVESFIFAAQAAIGAGFIGFFVGRKTK